MRQENNQSGFVGVVVTLVVVVAVIAVAGYLFYQHDKGRPLASSSTISNSQSTASQETMAAQSAQAATQYLHIKEWGVALPLPANIKDAYYTMVGSSKGTDGLPNTAWLGLTSTNRGGCNISTTGPPTTTTPIGSIVRVTSTEVDMGTGKLFTQENPNGVTIGNYYYAYQPWNNKKCASASSLQSIDSAFATAAKGIVTAASN